MRVLTNVKINTILYKNFIQGINTNLNVCVTIQVSL